MVLTGPLAFSAERRIILIDILGDYDEEEIGALFGSAEGVGTVTGQTNLFTLLQGVASGLGVTTGQVLAEAFLAAIAAGIGTTTAALAAALNLQGVAAGLGTTTAALSALALLQGQADGLGTIVGVILSDAMMMLVGETNGLAIDATADSMAIKDTTTPANNYDGAINGKLNNNGTSPKMVYNSSGTLVWAPHNIALQSDTIDNATWNKVGVTVSANTDTTHPDGTAADEVIEDTGNTDHRVRQSSLATVVGLVYTVSWDMKTRGGRNTHGVFTTGASNRSHYDLNTGTLGTVVSEHSITITPLGSGWHRLTCRFTATSTSTELYIYSTGSLNSNLAFVGDTAKGFYIRRVQLNRGYSATSYVETTTAAKNSVALDYNPTTLAILGILSEPQRINTITRSQEFDNAAWTKTACSATADSIAAPDGTTTADLITNDGTAAVHRVVSGAVIATATQNAISVFAKAGSATHFHMMLGGSNTYAQWRFSDGALVFSGAGTGTLTSTSATQLPNGWWRFEMVATQSSGSIQAINFHGLSASQNASAPSETSSATYYLWGAQAEAIGANTDPVSTSYIQTVSASITRTADLYQILTSLLPFSATAGTFFTLGTALASNNYYAALHDNTTNEMIIVRNFGSGAFTVTDGGAPQVAISLALTSNERALRVAWAANDFAMSVDGAAVGTNTDNTGTLPTVTRLSVASGIAGQNCRYLKKLMYAPRRVPNGDLPTFGGS